MLSKEILDRLIKMIKEEVRILHQKEEKGRCMLINLSTIGPKPTNPMILLGLCNLLRACLNAAGSEELKKNNTHVQDLIYAFLRTQVQTISY